MKLRDKLNNAYGPDGYYDSSIGKLAIYSPRVKDERSLYSELGNELSKVNSETFLRTLIRHICYPVRCLGEDNRRPNEPCLSEADIAKMSSNEINDIAKIYLDIATYLYREFIDKTEIRDGKKVISSEDGDIIHHKNDGESNMDYLYRLYTIRDETYKKRYEDLLGPFKMAQFSDSAMGNIKNALNLGSSLHDSINMLSAIPKNFNNIKLAQQLTASPLSRSDTEINDLEKSAQDLLRSDVESKWAPFRMLESKLNELVERSNTSIDYLVKMNDAQLIAIAETKTSSNENTRYSKVNMILTIFVIVLSILGLCLTWDSLRKSEQETAFYRDSLKSSGSELRKISFFLSANADMKNDAYEHQLSEQQNSREQLKNFISSQMSFLENSLEGYRTAIASDRKTIYSLQDRISELENGLNIVDEIKSKYMEALHEIQELKQRINTSHPIVHSTPPTNNEIQE